MARPWQERLNAKLVESEELFNGTPCWLFTGCLVRGYGLIGVNTGYIKLTHRLAYEENIGPIPEGLELDHLCRNRSCCNPDHREAVTRRENIVRGLSPSLTASRAAAITHCPHGHLYSPENTSSRKHSDGYMRRYCLECRKIHNEKAATRKRVAKVLQGLRPE